MSTTRPTPIVSPSSDLYATLSKIEKTFGKGTIMRLGDEAPQVPEDAIATGALSLDLALGIGGVPRGRIVEIYGPESTGKTTLVYHILAEAQRQGGTCAFIDAEHAMDPAYAATIGVDVDALLVSQPDCGEQALEITDMLARSGTVDVIAVDSVAALTPRAELEGQMGDASVGMQARMMSQAMRKLTGNLSRTNTLCLFTNQLREKIGVMFGSPETQPGGRALKFYASQRLDIRRVETLKNGTEAVGNRVKVKVVKNKVAAPFKIAEFDIEFGTGISVTGCILDMAIEHDVVTKSGAHFTYGQTRLGHGRANAKAFLDEHPAIAEEIRQRMQVNPREPAVSAPDSITTTPTGPIYAEHPPPQTAPPVPATAPAPDLPPIEPPAAPPAPTAVTGPDGSATGSGGTAPPEADPAPPAEPVDAAPPEQIEGAPEEQGDTPPQEQQIPLALAVAADPPPAVPEASAPPVDGAPEASFAARLEQVAAQL